MSRKVLRFPGPGIIAADLEAALDGARSAAMARSVSGGWLERVPVPGDNRHNSSPQSKKI
jgi:hypothetical protein